MTAEEKIRIWCEENSLHTGGDNLFVSRLRERFNDMQIAYILVTIDGTCNHCWDANTGCQCWNDE